MIRHLTTALTGLILLTAASISVASGIPQDGVLAFDILRNGEAIGHHILRFRKTGTTVDVHVDAEVDYRFGFIPLYRFDHKAHEIWHQGVLHSMSATTDDNGDGYTVTVERNGSSALLSVNGETVAIERGTIPASLWNIALVKQGLLLDPADGELMSVSIADAGDAEVTVRGKTVRARHYVMTGDFERDLWYDDQGVLIQVWFKGDDGSEIRYQLR